jgi:hypothetical protein
MKLTQEQVDWIKGEQEVLLRLNSAKPSDTSEAITMRIRWDALNLLIEMHNLAVRVEKAEEERQARIEKGKANLGIK